MKYSFSARLFFYLTLGYYKLTSFLECRNLRLKVFLSEFKFLFTVLGLRKLQAKNTSEILLKTKFGDFIIRDIDIDLTVASPSFERLDLNELLKRIGESLKQKKSVIFIDAGAGFGTQSIAVGNAYKRFSNQLSILAFEPEPESFRLLTKNIQLNKLQNVTALKVALSNKKDKQQFYFLESMKQIVSFPTPQKITMTTTTLDSYLKDMQPPKNVDVFMKFDIEGHEVQALQGAKKIIKLYKDVVLMVEDSVTTTSSELTNYLLSNATFLTKKTDYNSFWKLSS